VSADGALAGCTVLVTRAAAQAVATVAALEAVGARAWCLPTLVIGPPADAGALDAALARREAFDIAVFTSANAVTAVSARLLAVGGLTAGTTVAALGRGTEAALRSTGIVPPPRTIVIPPDTADSEALLDTATFGTVAGRHVVVFTGDDPRPWLADTLAARGARVEVVPTYARHCPPPVDADVAETLATSPLDAVTAASTQGLAHLYAMVDPVLPPAGRRLRALPHVVTHARIAAAARDVLGVHGRTVVADDAHTGTVRALVGILDCASRRSAPS
jgi:uroporphyrinogen-III synthase